MPDKPKPLCKWKKSHYIKEIELLKSIVDGSRDEALRPRRRRQEMAVQAGPLLDPARLPR